MRVGGTHTPNVGEGGAQEVAGKDSRVVQVLGVHEETAGLCRFFPLCISRPCAAQLWLPCQPFPEVYVRPLWKLENRPVG